jgi:glycine oxidase
MTEPCPTGLAGVFTPEDHAISPRATLRAMDRAVVERGGRKVEAAFAPGDAAAFDAVVIAAGAESRRLSPLAPETRALTPIKGQLIRFPENRTPGPILRSTTIYLSPQADGLLAGATMEPGRDDRHVVPEVVEGLRRQAEALAPALVGRAVEGLAGVRAATPDGAPMIGPSRTKDVFLATGARRNGWLLAPLVGPMLASYLSGEDGGAFAKALDPRRFGF